MRASGHQSLAQQLFFLFIVSRYLTAILVLPAPAQAPQADRLDSRPCFVSKGRDQPCKDAKSVEKNRKILICGINWDAVFVWDV